jgi:uncharacterized protein (DUF2267 family)
MIFLTGGTFTSEAQDFLDRVANARLHKPFELKELRRVVAECIVRHVATAHIETR